jgi:hypothetical protein
MNLVRIPARAFAAAAFCALAACGGADAADSAGETKSTNDDDVTSSKELASGQLGAASTDQTGQTGSGAGGGSGTGSGSATGNGTTGGTATADGTCPKGHWCSALYPPTWTAKAPADAEGRFLHDFSYAGYHAGDAPPATPPGTTYDVASYGADKSGAVDATAAVQSAINAASVAGGGVVFFPAGTYQIAGTLSVTTSGVVLRGVGAASYLRFTKAAGLAYTANLTFSGALARDVARPLTADANERADEVVVANTTGLAPGDDVAIGWAITDAFTAEHNMTGTWTAFANQYQVFFRTKVVSITGNTVKLDVPLRYRALVRDGASLQKETGYLSDVGFEHLSVSNAVTWASAWAEDRAHLVAFKDVRDSWINDVHSVASADVAPYHLRSGGVLIENSKRMSVLSSSMGDAENRGQGGNGYLFEVSRTNDILFADTEAKNGRHGFIQNWGFGNVGTVYLRCVSAGSAETTVGNPVAGPTEQSFSEHHHSLAMATLVDDSRIDDGFVFRNRGAWSTGAGHTATESVVWRASGAGKVVSKQWGWGYIIGTKGVTVDTNVDDAFGAGTGPVDFVEGKDQGDTLYPKSLYEDQRAKRLKAAAP